MPFEWTAPDPPGDDTLPDGWEWDDGARRGAPVALVAAVLASSPSPEDRYAVEALGAEETARRILELAPGFEYLPGRWEVLAADAEPAGFVLPVLYTGSRRGGLDEATIYHMGVLPGYRGRGIGRLLLRRATRLLVEHGVWRIFCDTAEGNAPMVRLFESEGWARLPARERPVTGLAGG